MTAGDHAGGAVGFGEIRGGPDGVALHLVAGGEGEEVESPLITMNDLRRTAGFDPDQVKAALLERGLTAREDTGGRGDIHTASYKSYHTTTPNGFDLQISATTKANRGA